MNAWISMSKARGDTDSVTLNKSRYIESDLISQNWLH